MSAQTKTEYLLDAIAARLGVPKPAEGQVDFSPEPLGLLKGLVDLLADPTAAKKSIAAASQARDAIAEAQAAQKKLETDRDRVDTEIKAARKAHDEAIAAGLAAHTMEMQSRTKSLDTREQAIAAREKETDDELAKLKTERADLKRRIDAIRTATA